jgi:hypothetical protein
MVRGQWSRGSLDIVFHVSNGNARSQLDHVGDCSDARDLSNGLLGSATAVIPIHTTFERYFTVGDNEPDGCGRVRKPPL